MASVCFYFQVHQPYRLRHYTIFDTDTNYFDEHKNAQVCRKVAGKCYLPTNQLMLDLIRQHEGRFKIAYSITGVILEQFKEYAPEVLASFQELAETGCVEFLGETYYHSLSFLFSPKEFAAQIEAHKKTVQELFGQTPRIFRNTELVYNNDLAATIERIGGFDAILAEGADHILGWRSPNFVYRPPNARNLKLLLKNYRLSDDIAFRFSNRGWREWPLRAEKFAQWVNAVNGNGYTVNLFMDYETFGEHQWEDTGIFEFLRHLPGEILRNPDNDFKTPSEVADRLPRRRRGRCPPPRQLGRHRAGSLRLARATPCSTTPCRNSTSWRTRSRPPATRTSWTTGASCKPPTISTTCARSGSPTATCTSTSTPTIRPTIPTSTS